MHWGCSIQTLELIAIGIVAGVVAAISPCILPVLPVILTAGLAPSFDGTIDVRRQRRRALATVGGLITSFVVLTLFGAVVLSSLGLPIDLQSTLGPALIALVGISLLIPGVATFLERPFARLFPARPPNAASGGLVLGLALGAVFVPCAGPVLAAITIAAATNRVSGTVIVVTCAFGLGLAIPLVGFALSGPLIATRVASLRRHGRALRAASGAVLLAMALAIWLGSFDGLQRAVPPYAATIAQRIEGTAGAHHLLEGIAPPPHHHQGTTTSGTLENCTSGAPKLQWCGDALAFDGITGWRNTASNKALTMMSLRGHVVLLDFWTYSCINCQRELPHLEAWARTYGPAGLVIVGVHTPEYAFEHDPANVTSFLESNGVTYPVALDPNATTWGDYLVTSWPTTYLIDANGVVRHLDDTEGGYGHTESLLRALLVQANPRVALAPPTQVLDQTPSISLALTPEFHFGSGWTSPFVNALVAGGPFAYTMPTSIPTGNVGLGGIWDQETESITAHNTATVALRARARNIYLVVGGTGTVVVRGPGHVATISVHGAPHIITVLARKTVTTTQVLISASDGLSFYSLTFG